MTWGQDVMEAAAWCNDHCPQQGHRNNCPYLAIREAIAGRRQTLVRRVAEAIAEAADDLDAFAYEHEDSEMWDVNAEDRTYWTRLAEAALAVSADASSQTEEA